MKENSTAKYSGIGICDVLLIVFVVLKLCHVISWSWWWVLAPLWIPVGIVLLIAFIALIVVGIQDLKE